MICLGACLLVNYGGDNGGKHFLESFGIPFDASVHLQTTRDLLGLTSDAASVIRNGFKKKFSHPLLPSKGFEINKLDADTAWSNLFDILGVPKLVILLDEYSSDDD